MARMKRTGTVALAPTFLELAVFMHLDGNFVPAGLLNLTEEGTNVIASSFTYGTRYIERANAAEIDPVSLPLSDPETIRGVELFPVDGLTLFGGIRDAAPDGWGRRVIESRMHAPLNSLPESTYLLAAGSERMGALDIRTGLQAGEKANPRTGIRRLEYLMEAADRIEAGSPIPAQLEDIFDAGSSMGGMRPKATVEDEAGKQWLAKFRSNNDPMDVPCIEAATLRLAGAAGLDAPEVKTETLAGRTVMLIERFDRTLLDGSACRRHMISALTMLGCHESESRNKSYGEIADRIRRHGVAQFVKRDQRELFGRMVFNILVTNDDDHLRNHAFLWDGEHKGWRLSPLYDVMPRPMVSYERHLHLGVGLEGRLATLDNALSAASRFGLTRLDANEVIDTIWRVVAKWREFFASYGVPGAESDKIAPAFRPIDDVLSTDAASDTA